MALHPPPSLAPDVYRRRRLAVVVGALAAAIALAAACTALPAVERSLAPTTTTTTIPPGTVTLASPAAASRPEGRPPVGLGAFVTDTGVVLPIVADGDPAITLTPCANAVAASGRPLTDVDVVLDPGHGGEEVGAVGPNGMTEADLNLAVANAAAELLRDEGLTVVLTRTTDIRLTLDTRGAIARSLAPDAFVSIHHNAAPSGTSATPGSELYHQHDRADSRRLAGLLWEELQAHLGPELSEWSQGAHPGVVARLSDTGDDYYGIVRNSQGVPGVLSEAAYLSDPEEAALLASPAGQALEAGAIRDAVVRYLTTEDPGSGFEGPFTAASSPGGGGGTAGCDDPQLTT